jgi:hypothetical protein
LRNLSIVGAGTGTDGIRILNGAKINIEHCSIQGFINQGIDIIPSTAGLVQQVNVSNSEIRHNTLQGIQVLPTGTATVKLTVSECVINDHGASGIDVGGNNNSASVTKTTLSNNNPGAQVQLLSSTMSLDNCLIANNTTGITAGVGQAAVIRVHNSSVVNNTTAAAGGTGTVVGFTSNMVIGNGGTNTLTGVSAAQQ